MPQSTLAKHERVGSNRFEASFLVNWNRPFQNSGERFFASRFVGNGFRFQDSPRSRVPQRSPGLGDQFNSQNHA
jgi:hypothetical protein